MEEEPYASLNYQCTISSSQENFLQYCFLARESQEGLTPFSNEESISFSDPDEFPLASTGIMICSPPDGSSDSEKEEDTHPKVEGEFQTSEERLLNSSSGQPRRMNIDEYLDWEADQPTDDAFYDDHGVDAVDDASHYAAIGHLGKNRTSEFFSKEKSFSGNGSPMMGTVPVVDVEKSGENRSSRCGLEENEVSMKESPMQEDLGLLESKNEGLCESSCKNPIEFEKVSVNVVDNPCDSVSIPQKSPSRENEVSRCELEENEVSMKESPMKEDLGFLESKNEGLCESSCKNQIEFEKNLNLNLVDNPCDSESTPQKSLSRENEVSRCELEENEVSRKESPMQEDLGFLESKNEGLCESSCKNPIEFEKNLNLNFVDNPCDSQSTPQKSPSRENEVSRCELEENEVSMKESSMQEDLGFLELKNEDSGESSCKNPIEFEMNLNLNVVDNVEFASGEDCVGDVAEKALESTVEKNLGFLKCSSDQENEVLMRKSPMQEDLGFLELQNEGLGESACKNLIELEKNLNLNVVDNVEFTIGEDCVEDVAEKALESTVEKNLGVLKCSSGIPCDSEKGPESLVAVSNEKVVDINASDELDLKSCSDNSKENFPVLRHPDIPESSKDVIMEDSSPTAIEKDIRHDLSTDKVLGFDNMQTDELFNDDGKPGNNSKEELEKSEHADSSDIPPEVTSKNPPGLRRLPNWVEGGSDSAMEHSNQSGNRRVGKAENSGQAGKKPVGEAEDLGYCRIKLVGEGSVHGGERFGEASGSSSVAEEDLDHGENRFVEAEGSSRAAEALPSVNESQTIKKFLDASHFEANHISRGNVDNSRENNPRTVDILEAAVRAGMKFPRPRWWRPKGYGTRY